MCGMALIPGIPPVIAAGLIVIPAGLWGIRSPVLETVQQRQVPSELRATIGSVVSIAQQVGHGTAAPALATLTGIFGLRHAFAVLNLVYLVAAPTILLRAPISMQK
eukprot:TRINITY_DN93163_c0_g1_i1.p1 TRINITY_DN93163_c0_g1~~TRINITY_DN93163_c0_g1_i1.p1  ORF type:complete len:106 (+),score=17.20 TRINITY_DN93163_c0_g1_i1:3-320(+)